MPTKQERQIIKEIVGSGNVDKIQEVLDKNELKRKVNKAFEIDHDNKIIRFTVTTDTVDRDGERVMPKAYENNMTYFLDNPIVLFGHNHGEPAVGRVTEYSILKDKVTMSVKFATGLKNPHPLADVLWSLYSDDDGGPFMRMCSIGFIPLTWSDDVEEKLDNQTGVTYTDIEPIELSLVNIGSNRLALSQMEKIPDKIKGDSVLKDVLQQILDGDVEAGISNKTETETSGERTQLKQESITMNDDKEKQTTESESTETKETEKPKVDPEIDALEKQARIAEAKAKIAKSEADIAGSQAKVRALRVQVKSANLGTYLNDVIGDGDDREELIRLISESADRSENTIKSMLDGKISCPDELTLQACSEVLKINLKELEQMAEEEGLDFVAGESEGESESDGGGSEGESESEGDDSESEGEGGESEGEDDTEAEEQVAVDALQENDIWGLAALCQKGNVKAVEKMYGMSGMFEGSYEERQRLINNEIGAYLEYELDLSDKYWIDYSLLSTKDTEILVYSHDKNQVYSIAYQVDDKGIEFNSIEPAKLTYEIIAEMLDDGKSLGADENSAIALMQALGVSTQLPANQ